MKSAKGGIAWKEAEKKNTQNSYENFLEKYPNSVYAKAAAEAQDEASYWDSVQPIGTKPAYESYLEEYPKGIYAEAAKSKASEIERNDRLSKLQIETIPIPAGSFMMKSPKNEPERLDRERLQHRVTLSAFKMSKYAVTAAQFESFVTATGYQTDAEKEDYNYFLTDSKWEKHKGINWA